MGLKFRRGSTAQQSGSLAFGEPYVNTTLGTLVVGGATGDIVLSAGGTGSTGNFGAISGSGLDITGNANIAGNLTLGGKLTIGDASSDTVNVVASLSSSLIPSITNVFDLGSSDKIWRDLYISTGSIKFVDGTTVVSTLDLTKLSALEAATGSANTAIDNLNTITASLNNSVTELNSFSSSQLTQNSALATITGSLISTASNHEQRISANESVSASYARTDSANIFSGNQTITGSLYVSADLVVQGSSSIQNISSSTLNIGTNLVTVAVNDPSVRFGGLAVIDSGSAGGSGSFLYDSVQDEFIFVHKGNGTNVTSSHFVLGPETYDNLGNESYLTSNRLPKGTGKEHLVDSNITDNGSTITLSTNSVVTGSLTVTSAVNAASALINGYLEIKTGTDVNSVKIGRNTGGSATRTVAIGYGSGGGAGSYNVAIGDQAAQQLAGSNNVVIGATSLNATINASSNTVVGSSTGNTVALGNTNTLIGSGISLGVGSATNTIIGAAVSEGVISNNIILANGSGAIKFRFDGTNNILNNNSVVSGSLTVTGSIVGSIASTNGVVSGSSQVTLSSTTGGGTTSNVQFGSLGIGMVASGTSGRIDAANDVVAFSTSDIRLKENIKPIENALDKISKISGNTYDWKSELKDVHGYEGNDVGVIAQEVEVVLPQLVQDRDNGYKAVKYDKLVALLIEGIKEQQTQIHNLTLEIENLKKNNSL